MPKRHGQLKEYSIGRSNGSSMPTKGPHLASEELLLGMFDVFRKSNPVADRQRDLLRLEHAKLRKGRLYRQGLQTTLGLDPYPGAVARLSALECVRETLALALEELDGTLAQDQRPEFWDQLWESCVESKLDYKLQKQRSGIAVQTPAKRAGIVCAC
jgi:hypothetical protein